MLDRFKQESALTGAQYAFDEWGWISFAQHHSLPTRLLDWSQSALVGLYFAVETGEDKDVLEPDGEYFILRPAQLNQAAGDASGHPRLLSSSDSDLNPYLPGQDSTRGKYARAVISPLLFDRIRFQSGTFTLEQRPAEPSVEEPLRSSSALESFIVPGDAKQGIRDELSVLGFSEASIYRDLDRIAKRIHTSHK